MWTPLGITPPAFSILLVQTWLLISVSTLALEAGGSSLNPIQASENIVILETHMCVPPQCQHGIEKTGVWFLLLAWWRMKRVTCFAVWRMELYARHTARLCEHLQKGCWAHSLGFFFGAAAFLFVLDRLCFFWRAIFSFNFGKAASIVSLGEAKNGFIFGTKLCLRVWSQNLSFLEFVVDNSRLACVGSGRMRAEWVVAALLWFYKHDSGS